MKIIIISQDKKIILNFGNIQNIRIERYTTHEKGKNIYKIFAGNFEGYVTEIGAYKTEERAKEVLEEIVKTYMDCNIWSSYGVSIINKVYEMPLK